MELRCSIFIAIALVVALASQAQQNVQFDLDYNIDFPAGSSFRSLVTQPAYKGFTAGFAYAFTNQLSAGLSIGYNDYYQKFPRQVYSNGPGSDISAVITNSIQQAPLLATIEYSFLKKGMIRPYVGGGAGVNFIAFDQYAGEFDNPVNYAKFALRGQAGVLIPLSRGSSTAIRVGASYNYAPLKEQGITNLNNWGVHAGIRLPL